MLPNDVEARVAKIVSMYGEAEAAVNLTLARTVVRGTPNRKQSMRATTAVKWALHDLQAKSRPAVAGALRLAFVRGARSSNPAYSLTEEDQHELHGINLHLSASLAEAEQRTLETVQGTFRRLQVEQTALEMAAAASQGGLVATLPMQGFQAPQRAVGEPWSLQQHARTLVSSIGEQVFARGASVANGSMVG